MKIGSLSILGVLWITGFAIAGGATASAAPIDTTIFSCVAGEDLNGAVRQGDSYSVIRTIYDHGSRALWLLKKSAAGQELGRILVDWDRVQYTGFEDSRGFRFSPSMKNRAKLKLEAVFEGDIARSEDLVPIRGKIKSLEIRALSGDKYCFTPEIPGAWEICREVEGDLSSGGKIKNALSCTWLNPI